MSKELAPYCDPLLSKLKSFYAYKPVLVTGGAGFIGSHVIDLLKNLGARPTVLDNLSTGKLSNLSNNSDKIRFINQDICSLDSRLRSIIQDSSIIFHLAALSTVSSCQSNPSRARQVNAEATSALCQAMPKDCTLVFSSSTAVYGNLPNPVLEEMPFVPKGIYAETKAEAELAIQACGGNAIILRYTNVVGSRARTDPETAPVVSKFVCAIKSDQPITIFGNGSATRDYVDVGKVALANIASAAFYSEAKKLGLSNKSGQPIFNVAEGKSLSLTQLLEMVQCALGKRAKQVNFYPERSFEVSKSEASGHRLDNFFKCIGLSSWPQVGSMEFLRNEQGCN